MMLRVAIRYYFDLKNTQWMNREKLDRDIEKKLYNNIKYAYENVPYYRDAFDKAGISPSDIRSKEDIVNLPITTKNDILRSKLSYVSDEFDVSKLHISQTSGSTGEPFVSYFDDEAWSTLKFASKFRARSACGFNLFEKFVVIEAMSVDEAKEYNSSFSVSKLLFRKRFLSVYDSLESHVDFYLKFKPTTIYGFPSYFVNLVSFLKKKGVKLDFVDKIFTSSEVLSDGSRKIVEDYFGCKICDVYGSTETKEISWQIPGEDGYYINEDLVYLECIDENGNAVSEGEEGQLVVTSLVNKAMPLIRYSTGDIGMILKSDGGRLKSDGSGSVFVGSGRSLRRSFKLMKPLYGRIVDYFILPDGRKISPYELTMSVEGIDNILQYQIVQKKKDLVWLNLCTNSDYDLRLDRKIRSNFRRILGKEVKVKIKHVKGFKRDVERRKFRIVISEVNAR